MSLVRCHVRNGAGYVVLDRAEKRNALNHALVDEFETATAAFARAGVAVAVLRANGPVFCAGADLAEARADPKNPATERLIWHILETPFLWVAVIEGPALGAGVGLAAITPVVLVSAEAWMSLPEVSIGLFPTGVMAYLEPVIGTRKSVELGITGGRITAAEAVNLGLANETIPAPLIEARLAEWVGRLTAMPRIAGSAALAWRSRFHGDAFRERKRALDDMLDVESLSR